jgi:5'(3')-deoxyribonucleotidase
LGIDLDGVVANFTQGWMTFYNRDFGADLKFEDSQNWGDLVDLTHFEDIGEFWRWSSQLEGHSVFWHLETFPGAVEALRTLDSDGHDLIVLTTKPTFAIDDTHDWIARHEIPATEVFILDDKWLVDCDVYLDDSPYVIPSLLAHRPERTVCRYIRPWNHPLDGAIDVNDFDDFREVVHGLA